MFIISSWIFILLCTIVSRYTDIKLKQSHLVGLILISFVIYAFPFPKFQFLWVTLPDSNVLSYLSKWRYEISLSSEKAGSKQEKSYKKLNVSEEELKFLIKRKELWFAWAKEDPERVFSSLKTSWLETLTDEYGNNYWYEVLYEAISNKPELAFRYINSYKDWKDETGNTMVTPLLQLAIEKEPKLAFDYIDSYQNIIEHNEKIAKWLLQYAAQLYKDPLTFEQLFSKVEGRKNKNNVILVFLESASSVDSKKYWGLHDKLPLIDKISDDWVALTHLHANGMSSDMWHIATLLWVEPVVYDFEWTTYDNYVGYSTPLAEFFNELWYHTTFLSTARLSFLNQKEFIKNVGYQTIIWEEAFKDKKHYTFDAAPDEDLYNKAIEIINNETWAYFLTLQTISSHTPYNTPYWRSEEEMYRYEDESFANFYEQLKENKFFDDGILIVLWDHRKMTPLEDEEFKKRWATAAAKIVGFVIGNWIKKWKIDNNLYQQTDIFYSILREFGKWDVTVFQRYNDIFTKEAPRDWTVKQRYEQKKVNIADSEWHEWYIDLNRMEIIDWWDYFPEEEILNYLQLSIDYQKRSKTWMWENTSNDKIILISHRWEVENATENSIGAFKAARDEWAEWLEMDLTTTKDWQLVVYHGPKLYNNTICKQEQRDICEMTRDEVQECLLNNWEKIQTFESVISQIKNRFSFVFVDYKAPDNPNCNQDKITPFEDAVNLVQKYKMDAKVVFSSYDTEITNYLGKKWDLVSALDTYSLSALNKLENSYFTYFMTPSDNFSDTLVKQLQMKWIESVAYVVNDPTVFQKLASRWVRFVMTDEISKLKKVIQK